MSIELILMGLGLVLICLIIEDAFDAVWKAAAEKRRKAEEEERLQRVERIIAEARMMGMLAASGERDSCVDIVQSQPPLLIDARENRHPLVIPARFEP